MRIMFAILGLFLSIALNCQAAEPEDCLNRIQSAIDTCDATAFGQLVDLDSMTESAIDALAEIAAQPGDNFALDPMLALPLLQLSGPQGAALRNMLGTEIKKYILNGVASGSFAGRRPVREQTGGLMSSLFSNASNGRKEILAKGEPVAYDEGWHMPFTLHDYGNNHDYRIIGRFLATDSGAKLVEIENLDELVTQLQNEAAE